MTQVAPAVPIPKVGWREPERLDLHGLPVAYRRDGAGEPVLFLHGVSLTRTWLPFHRRLAAGADVVAPSHPGFGETPLPDEWVDPWGDDRLFQRDFLDALGLDSVHVVGYSLGGWLGANLAINHPERVRSLTVIAPLGLRVPGHPIADFFGAAPGRTGELLFNGDLGDHAGLVPDRTSAEEVAYGFGEMAGAARLMWNPRYDLALDYRLPRLTVPSLVVAAEHDRLVPDAHAKRWAELLPSSRLEVVPGTGHALTVQEPERTADLVAAFVAGVAGNGSEEVR